MKQEKRIRQHDFPQIPLHIVQGVKAQGDNGQRFQRLYNATAVQAPDQGETCVQNAVEADAASESDLKKVESEAYAKGYSKGEQDGIEAAAKKVQAAIDTLMQAAVGLRRVQQTVARKSEARLVELALAIGRKIVGYEITTNRQVVVNIAREALKSVGNQQEVTLKINPTDLHFLEKNQLPLSQLAPHISQVKVEAADSIDSGGCVIESPCGVIDAQIDSQLQIIEKAFLSELNKISEQKS